MNRRDFIKTSIPVMALPVAVSCKCLQCEEPEPEKKEHFTVDCFMYDKEVGTKRRFAMNNEYHHGFHRHLTYEQQYGTIEDTVQALFEHVKEFDLKRVNMSYNILWHGKDDRIIQAGYYNFHENHTLHMSYVNGKGVFGWHGHPPYTDYYAVDSA
jgi:hypothetical protein